MTDTTIVIKRDMKIRGTLEAVWNAIATPAGISTWFSERIEGEIRPGAQITFMWNGGHSCGAKIEAVEPMSRISFRWHPCEPVPYDRYPEGEATTVEFVLRQDGDHVFVTLTESGFERIPEDRRTDAIRENWKGWEDELDKFIAKFRD